MCIGTSFVCVACHPTLFSPSDDRSCTCFFGLYGPLYDASRIQERLCVVQSLYGTLSRPTVQSSRGSMALKLPAAKFVSGVGLFHAPLAIAIGKPTASTWKKLTRL